jgi:hypothetical protein
MEETEARRSPKRHERTGIVSGDVYLLGAHLEFVSNDAQFQKL